MTVPEAVAAAGNHLWQSTAFAAMAGAVAYGLRENAARVRYGVWLAASAKFLAPFALLSMAGSRIDWQPAAASKIAPAVAQMSEPFSEVFYGTRTTSPSWNWASVLVMVWAMGCAAVFFTRARRWWRARTIARAGSRLAIAGPIPARSVAGRMEPGIFGLWRPVLLLPEGIEDRLSPTQLDAVLAHEFCHARRRDNLTAAIHMAVETLFWFHPLVWWIGARLVEERERACDEAVVGAGGAPDVYVSGILGVCRHYLERPRECGAGVTGADLKKRVGAILEGRSQRAMTASRRALLGVAAAAAIAAPVAVGILRGQTKPLRFEVAAIKRVKGDTGRGSLEMLKGGRVRMGGVTVKGLIAMAYGLREPQVSGGPKWIETEAYSLDATPERSVAAAESANPAPGDRPWSRMQERLQTLLAERCKLRIERDSKETQGYALVIAKNGFKLAESKAGEDTPPGTNRSRGQIHGRAGTMRMLATVLSNYVGKPVDDRTSLEGRYDYKLEYADDIGHNPGEPGAAEVAGASIFTALQEQLGLRLEPAKVQVESIRIERVERPSAN